VGVNGTEKTSASVTGQVDTCQMGMSEQNLQALSDEELKRRFDEEAKRVVHSYNSLASEILRRKQANDSRLQTIFTIVAIVISLIALFKP